MFLHTGSAMGCLPECQISCTGVCIPACCAATPVQLPIVYSSSMAPRQPDATMYQCPYPCPNACAPVCSLKCCNSVYHVSPLYLRRKGIWRKRKKCIIYEGHCILFWATKRAIANKWSFVLAENASLQMICSSYSLLNQKSHFFALFRTLLSPRVNVKLAKLVFYFSGFLIFDKLLVRNKRGTE